MVAPQTTFDSAPFAPLFADQCGDLLHQAVYRLHDWGLQTASFHDPDQVAVSYGSARPRCKSALNAGDAHHATGMGRSLATPLPNPLLLGHRAIRDDVAWGVLAGRIGLRDFFTPQTGELCLGT